MNDNLLRSLPTQPEVLVFLCDGRANGAVSVARLAGDRVVLLCHFYEYRVGLMSGDSVCDLCDSRAEYIKPMKYITSFPRPPMRREAPSHLSAK